MAKKIAVILSLLSVFPISLFGQATPTDFWGVKPWEMWAATPAYKKLCNQNGHCYSIKIVFPDRHIIEFQDNAIYGVTAILPNGGVGVLRDFGSGSLRCFSDSTTSCSPASFPPGYSPAYDAVPVLSEPSLNFPTPQAKVYYALQAVQVNSVNTTTCAVTWTGQVIHSGAHFFLTSYDFGSPIGVLNNIYVTEETQGCPPTASNPTFCQRLERYFFSPNFGRTREEGWNDPICDGVTPALCLGNYSVAAPGATNWIPSDDPPVDPISEICP